MHIRSSKQTGTYEQHKVNDLQVDQQTATPTNRNERIAQSGQ